jgi:hypothetical protein
MRVFLLSIILSFGIVQLNAQDIPPRLYINQTNVSSDSVRINYEINYGGYVELHLFDEDGKKIWINGNVKRRLGQYVFRIPSRPLKADMRYTFFLKYKGEEYHGSFYGI